MITKNTYAKTAIWRPDSEGSTTKQLVSSSVEVGSFKLTSGSLSAFVSLYDSNQTSGQPNANDLRWALDTSTTGSDAEEFTYPLLFTKGIYAVLEQGSGGNPILCMSVIPAAV
jgi:hypothetical protein